MQDLRYRVIREARPRIGVWVPAEPADFFSPGEIKSITFEGSVLRTNPNRPLYDERSRPQNIGDAVLAASGLTDATIAEETNREKGTVAKHLGNLYKGVRETRPEHVRVARAALPRLLWAAGILKPSHREKIITLGDGGRALMHLVANGDTNAAIADQLGSTTDIIKSDLSFIAGQLGWGEASEHDLSIRTALSMAVLLSGEISLRTQPTTESLPQRYG